MSKNTALKILVCDGNQLTSLDMSKNTNLTWLTCCDNYLTTLDMSANTNPERLYCYANRLATLNVSANTGLSVLQCGEQTSDGTTPQDLTLTMTADQKTTWDSKWATADNNGRVNTVVAE